MAWRDPRRSEEVVYPKRMVPIQKSLPRTRDPDRSTVEYFNHKKVRTWAHADQLMCLHTVTNELKFVMEGGRSPVTDNGRKMAPEGATQRWCSRTGA
jgi:hypothetical protein